MKRAVVALGALLASLPLGAAASSAPVETTMSRLVPVAPCRLFDSRPSGVSASSDTLIRAAGKCQIPATATAVAINVVATDMTQDGYLTVHPTGAVPATSTVNYRAGQTVNNSAITGLTNGAFEIFSDSAGDFAVDVSGYLEAASEPQPDGRLVVTPARRILDTRSGRRVAKGTSVTVTTAAPAGATAVVVNVTAADTSGWGFVTGFATGTAIPDASLLNFDRTGQTRAAGAIVPVSAKGQFNLQVSADTHLIVDLVGSFTGANAEPSTDGLYVSSPTPVRLVDTRAREHLPRLRADGTREFQTSELSDDPIAGLNANITVVQADKAGYWVARPAGVEADVTSTVNAFTGDPVANIALVGASDRGVAIHGNQSGDVIVDVNGWFMGTPATATLPVPSNELTGARNVRIISDSAMAGIRWNGALSSFQGFNAQHDLESCRRLAAKSCMGREAYAPLTVVEELRALGRVSSDDLLVIATGYNDIETTFGRDFEAVVTAARNAGYRHIAWVNYRKATKYVVPEVKAYTNYINMNTILRQKVESGRYPDVEIWDFATYTESVPEWFSLKNDDGVHQTVFGSFGVGDWVSRHVAHDTGRPCPQPLKPGAAPETPCSNPDSLPQSVGMPDIAGLYGELTNSF